MNKRIGINNILTIYNAATEEEIQKGKNWYKDARSFCRSMAKKHNVSIEIVIAVLAALSPRNKWERNLIDVDTCLTAVGKGLTPNDVSCSTFNKNKEKAFRIIQEKKPSYALTSNKVASFFDNIRYVNSDTVTVDIHAFSIFMGFRAEQGTLTDFHYETLTNAYQQAAEKVGLKPYEMQAITWVTWQRLSKKDRVRKVPPKEYSQGVRYRKQAA